MILGSASSCPKCKKPKKEKKVKDITFYIPTCKCMDEEVDKIIKQKDFEIKIERYNSSNIPVKYMYDDLKDWVKKEELKKTESIISEYLKQLEVNIQHGKGVIFAGNPGTGKTRLICYLCQKIIFNTNCSVYFTTPNEIFIKVVKKRELSWLSLYRSKDVLVIDDFSEINITDQEKEVLSDIINSRYNSNKSVFITTMCSLDLINARIGEHLSSRLIEKARGFISEIKSSNMRY